MSSLTLSASTAIQTIQTYTFIIDAFWVTLFYCMLSVHRGGWPRAGETEGESVQISRSLAPTGLGQVGQLNYDL